MQATIDQRQTPGSPFGLSGVFYCLAHASSSISIPRPTAKSRATPASYDKHRYTSASPSMCSQSKRFSAFQRPDLSAQPTHQQRTLLNLPHYRALHQMGKTRNDLERGRSICKDHLSQKHSQKKKRKGIALSDKDVQCAVSQSQARLKIFIGSSTKRHTSSSSFLVS